MAMFSPPIFTSTYLQPPNPLTTITPSFPSIPPKSLNFTPHTRNFRLPSVSSIPYPPINADYLQSEFSGHGTSFTTLGQSCVVRMALENGSVATLMLPSGLITSYKAPMWHGGLLELLHTTVDEAEDGGGGVVSGGVSVAFRCDGGGEDGRGLWCPEVWSLRSVGGSAEDSIQVELISSNSEDKIEFKHIITLQQDTISSEIVITNLNSSSLRLTGSIIGHLAVSTPEATYAIGLESSNYFVKPPVYSNFSIIPPDFNKDDSGSKNLWIRSGFDQFLSGWGIGSRKDSFTDQSAGKRQEDEEIEGEEDDNYKQLNEKFSMIYTSAPRNFTIMDRGKRNSVVVGREGFNELYMLSPGSRHSSYGKYSYLTIGQAALLKPVTIGPQSEWRGVQHLHNPNL